MATNQDNEVISKDAFDRMMFDDIKSASPVIAQMATDDTRSDLLSDVFSSLFKISPSVREGAPQPQSNLIKNMMGLQEYKDLTASTQLDEIGTALGLAQLGPTVIEKFIEIKKDNEKNGQQPNGPGGDGPEIPSEARRALRRAMAKAKEDADSWSSAIGLLAGKDSDEVKKMPVEERLELAKRFLQNKKFVKIAEFFGRLANIVNGELANNFKHGYDELHDITTGDSIHRMIPAELSKYKYARLLFYKDLVEKSLLQYDLQGVEKVGKGPMVVCLDISGSMGMQEGDMTREEWAKGVVFALSLIADKQNRPFGFIAFESKIHVKKFFPKGMSLQEKLEMMSVTSSGGTDFDKPFKEAFTIIEEEKSLKNADIVFITDGEADLSSWKTINTKKKETNVRIHAVGIRAGAMEALNKVADTDIDVQSFDDIEYAKTIITNVL